MARSFTQTRRLNEIAMRLHAPSGSAQPYGEEFWNRDRLTIAAKTGREFQHLMHACLRAAPNWAQVERLHNDNAAQIDRLDRATRDDVLAMLDTRERELKP